MKLWLASDLDGEHVGVNLQKQLGITEHERGASARKLWWGRAGVRYILATWAYRWIRPGESLD